MYYDVMERCVRALETEGVDLVLARVTVRQLVRLSTRGKPRRYPTSLEGVKIRGRTAKNRGHLRMYYLRER